MADRGGQYATLRGRVNQRSRSCSEAPAGPCDRAVAVCAGPAWPCAQRVLHRAMGVVWFGCVVGENACARIDPARQPCRCAVRLAIESQSRRDAMTSVNACASTRCTACMIANPDTNTRNRSLLHCANESRPALRSRADAPPSITVIDRSRFPIERSIQTPRRLSWHNGQLDHARRPAAVAGPIRAAVHPVNGTERRVACRRRVEAFLDHPVAGA
ncbi:hypothetical protein BCCR75502_03944 [Burkholderia sola]|nr:hypothetical protein BCCR75384_03944 [Burkholderia cenocepacia]CAG2317777.1 hypothetical protein BCCR75389_03929 [Burkholderia cenocepacia]CAG2317895.1 hypothetical protein BCCR75386_03945 [Burkholderia cenocepacia]CAG2317915.1 hypothetical protein BCCR75387_03944 [Burkholderia cenocepacia]CAG2317932.1 hypothetical protein BCCR75388_03946 [Burkholderia cenocepacia]